MRKLLRRKFANEAEEAKWWDSQMGVVEKNLVAAIKAGVAKRGGPGRLIQERRESKNITIRVAIADLERARRLAAEKGIGYQTYMKILLKEALDRESRQTLGVARNSVSRSGKRANWSHADDDRVRRAVSKTD